MKKSTFCLLFFVMVCNSYSQNSGVYLTAGDFINGKIHLKGDKKNVSVNAGLPFMPLYVRVKTEGSKYYFHKDSIWGILDNNQVYRFSNGDNFTLIANSGIMLYLFRNPGTFGFFTFSAKTLHHRFCL